MRILLLLLICVSFIHCRQSQNSKSTQSDSTMVWARPIPILSEEIEINLYNNNTFSFEGDIWISGSSIVTRVLISRGKFSVVNDTLILKDKFNDDEQKFLIRNNAAMGIKTFKPFMNRFLRIRHINEDLDISQIELLNIPRVNLQERRRKNALLRTGTEEVRFGWHRGIIDLRLIEPNRYLISTFGNIISEGVFKQNYNELILFDESIDYVFYFFLTEDGIIENMTPISEILRFN